MLVLLGEHCVHKWVKVCVVVHEWVVQTLDALSLKSQSFVFEIRDTLSKINPHGFQAPSHGLLASSYKPPTNIKAYFHLFYEIKSIFNTPIWQRGSDIIVVYVWSNVLQYV